MCIAKIFQSTQIETKVVYHLQERAERPLEFSNCSIFCPAIEVLLASKWRSQNVITIANFIKIQGKKNIFFFLKVLKIYIGDEMMNVFGWHFWYFLNYFFVLGKNTNVHNANKYICATLCKDFYLFCLLLFHTSLEKFESWNVQQFNKLLFSKTIPIKILKLYFLL